MDISASGGYPLKPGRKFAALHRDVWRTVRIAPLVFLVFPAIVWFPIDVAIEGVVANKQLEFWRELRFYSQLGTLAQCILGTLVTAVQMHALQLLAKRQSIRLLDVLRGGFEMWPRMIGVFFSAAWRISLATLFLVVPGIYLMVRYSLAMPVAAFEEKRGSNALEASGRYVKGCGWRILFLALVALVLYAPVMLAPLFLVPGGAGPVLNALGGVPSNVLAPLMVVGLALVYADRRKDWPAAEPVGQPDPTMPPGIGVRQAGAGGVWLAGFLSFLAAGLAFTFAMILSDRLVATADAAYEAGSYHEALAKYERAAHWFPDDPYLEYSLGWSRFMLDDPERAETHFARAVELEPENSYYLVGDASVLLELERFDEAGVSLERASELGHPEPETIQRLRMLINLRSVLAPDETDTSP